MCHFITAALPAGADAEAVASLFKSYRRALEPVDNDWVVAQLPAGDRYFLTTRGYCDCGTSLGSLTRQCEAPRSPEDEVRKLKRKGWSEAKIERWRAEKLAAGERARDRQEAMAQHMSEDAESWAALL